MVKYHQTTPIIKKYNLDIETFVNLKHNKK